MTVDSSTRPRPARPAGAGPVVRYGIWTTSPPSFVDMAGSTGSADE